MLSTINSGTRCSFNLMLSTMEWQVQMMQGTSVGNLNACLSKIFAIQPELISQAMTSPALICHKQWTSHAMTAHEQCQNTSSDFSQSMVTQAMTAIIMNRSIVHTNAGLANRLQKMESRELSHLQTPEFQSSKKMLATIHAWSQR